jgi:hypothetical protein
VVSEIKIEMQKSMDNNMNNDDDIADNTLLIPSHRNFRKPLTSLVPGKLVTMHLNISQ